MRWQTWGVALLMVAMAGSPSAIAQNPPGFDASYREQYDKWKAGLEQERREQWLTLAGLFWLKPGQNSFGSGSDNAVVFLEGKVPARAGVLEVSGKEVRVKFEPGTHALLNGTPFSDGSLAVDVTGHPSLVEIGSLRFEAIQRGERTGIRLWDLSRPEAKNYRGAIFYPLAGDYRVQASWVPYDKPRVIRVPNVLGDVSETQASGEVRTTIDGKGISLVAVGGDPAKGFFLIFSDPTRKTDTYPAGRFLETGPVKDGRLMLDFNYAYNPPCALTAYATCPLPPKENQLDVPVRAGEKYDRSHGHP